MTASANVKATRAFRAVAGHNPPVPPGIEVCEIRPGWPLGSVRDTIQWKRSNIERWLEQGAEDAAGALTKPRAL